MKKYLLVLLLLCFEVNLKAQTNPAITSWLINTSGIKGRHYVKGNSTPIQDNVLANVQTVQYSTNNVYISTHGIPAYITGPFQDGNPSLAQDQNAIFKFPLNPTKNTGTPTATTMGNIGVFINGVALFDYRDGVSWQNSSNSLKGGPLMGQGDNVWNRDAVVAERVGFDCAKAHPAMGNYHHHQNPSAFNLDLKKVSNVCDLYAADGLYAIDSTKHSPLIGFAYDGFPIYGAYAYKNTDGSGGIVRMKSSWSLRNITSRTTYYTGQTVTPGPNVSTSYPLGYFKEDYQYNPTSASTPDYLDEHNGRFCVTPEYPEGIYCYFSTVDENWNSTYPYVVGPTFYGVKVAAKVNQIGESVTNYVKENPKLSLSTNTLSIASTANSFKTFDVISNVDWTLQCDQKWLTFSSTSANGNKTITITAEENPSTNKRTAIVSIIANGLSTQTLNVIQDAKVFVLTVSTNMINTNSEADKTKSFDISTNTSWNITCQEKWISFDINSGTANAKIQLNIEANMSTSQRSADINISGNGVSPQLVKIVQNGTAANLSLSTENITVLAKANSDEKFDVFSNTDWTANSDKSWLTLSKAAGNGNSTINIIAEENKDTTSRTANISVLANGVANQNIKVVQIGAASISSIENQNSENIDVSVFPNPSSDLIVFQSNSISNENITIELIDLQGKVLQSTSLLQGSTVTYFDTKTLYSGEYLIKFNSASNQMIKRIVISK